MKYLIMRASDDGEGDPPCMGCGTTKIPRVVEDNISCLAGHDHYYMDLDAEGLLEFVRKEGGGHGYADGTRRIILDLFPKGPEYGGFEGVITIYDTWAE